MLAHIHSLHIITISHARALNPRYGQDGHKLVFFDSISTECASASITLRWLVPTHVLYSQHSTISQQRLMAPSGGSVNLRDLPLCDVSVLDSLSVGSRVRTEPFVGHDIVVVFICFDIVVVSFVFSLMSLFVVLMIGRYSQYTCTLQKSYYSLITCLLLSEKRLFKVMSECNWKCLWQQLSFAQIKTHDWEKIVYCYEVRNITYVKIWF